MAPNLHGAFARFGLNYTGTPQTLVAGGIGDKFVLKLI
jgi:hypothetical protein